MVVAIVILGMICNPAGSNARHDCSNGEQCKMLNLGSDWISLLGEQFVASSGSRHRHAHYTKKIQLIWLLSLILHISTISGMYSK